ncbi:MAG: hypothetical protein CL693_02955, partial [Cellvibrionaceae bacterium]|nr:hypothetical protein [Cellvibrionaceae bacterium]
MKILLQKFYQGYKIVTHIILLSAVSLQVAAQSNDNYSLPKIGAAENVTAESDPLNYFVVLFKIVGAVVLWLAVAWFGMLMFGSVIKAANEARGGDVSWMEAGKSMLGNVI